MLSFPHIIAHRGLSGVCPENTLPAFAAAVALSAEEIELDLWPSRDGELIVCHDADVDRTSDGSGLIAELTWPELRALDAGSWHDPAWAGVPFCRLDEVLAHFGGRVLMNLHLKDPGPEGFVLRRTLDLASQYGALEAFYFAGERDVLEWALRLAPQVPRCCLQDGFCGARMLDCADEYSCARVQFWNPHVTREDLARAHAAGILCNLFFGDAPDTPAEALRMIALGVDAPLTNWANLLLPAVRSFRL